MSRSPWPRLGRKLLLETPIFRIFGDQYRNPRTNQEGTFSVVDTADWVNVVALDREDNLILIRQFRFGTAELTLEVPGGMVDPGETPRAAAERELREESGYRADEVVDLGFIHPNPAIFNNRAHMFLCRGCERAFDLSLDEGEDIEVVVIPVEQALAMVRDGRISHALVAVALTRFALYREGKLALGSGP